MESNEEQWSVNDETLCTVLEETEDKFHASGQSRLRPRVFATSRLWTMLVYPCTIACPQRHQLLLHYNNLVIGTVI